MIFKKPFKGLTLKRKAQLLWAFILSFYYLKFLKVQTYTAWTRNGDVNFIGLLSLPFYIQEQGREERTRVRIIEEILYTSDPRLKPGLMMEDINFKGTPFFNKPDQLKHKD